ncbi:hypothetical protein GH714_026076 [Hevea brasiliensis]|uniref:Pentacotripeptide-repeat region of PRORP domain-containing protein n=1 Tax=Hevea brasiliensis TaxID=3981 RepID=A0A6A6N3I7_HEVBR|nr:hypothetical protein GH714_026076 [Hevea brasiliensis]
MILCVESSMQRLTRWQVSETMQSTTSNKCKDHCRPSGSEALPQGIVRKTSDFEMRPLWKNSMKDDHAFCSFNVNHGWYNTGTTVGLHHTLVVSCHQPHQEIFCEGFAMDDHVIHVSAVNQTKWWFAKRFLHPDIVAEYDYIFLWDEDLGVENFNPRRYLSIVKDEGLEISQPALDPAKSAVSHPITARQPKSKVHRRIYKFKGSGRCYHNSTSPPCIGWVEMMAPVFSRAAWQCVWNMIQAPSESRIVDNRLATQATPSHRTPPHALQRNSNPPPRDPNAPRLPDSTSALVGPRLNLHNRVQSLIRAFDLDNASLLARNAVYTRTRPTVFTCNAIIAAMYRAKRYNEAIALFKYFFEQHDIVPNVVSYNNLINAHCDEGRVDTALEIYRDIIANAPFSPSHVTYKHLTKGLIDAGRVDEAVGLLREMLNKGHGADSLVFNNIIKAFLDLGNLEKANEFFSELTERCLWYDGTVNATFMDWWFKQGKDKEAVENYKSFMDRKLKIAPPTGNALLEVLLRKVGTKPGSKPFQMDVAGYNNIIVRFCENEMLLEAEKFFTELLSKSLSPDVTSYRTLIDAYLKVERIDDALRLLTKMVQENLWVVATYATRVFGELIKNGKAVECAQILTKMGGRDPKPDPSVYDVVVRGLCEAGAFDSSKDILEQMMRYCVGVPPALKEFVTKAFLNAGKSQEIERVLDENRWRNMSGSPHLQRQTRMPLGSQMARDQPLGPSSLPRQALSGQPQMARQ